MKDTIISLKDIAVSYDGEQVLKNFNLDIRDGEFVTLLGPSGCGKTTVLRTIGGFITPDTGEVFFSGKNITALPPYKREVNTIFQKYALFPHLNVYDNIAFGMRLKKKSEREVKETVHKMLTMVNLNGYAHRGVGQLSGGQQQRVAIARALASDASVILSDEPTGNLDEDTAAPIANILMECAHQWNKCVVIVTHSNELARQADVVFQLKKGALQQL